MPYFHASIRQWAYIWPGCATFQHFYLSKKYDTAFHHCVILHKFNRVTIYVFLFTEEWVENKQLQNRNYTTDINKTKGHELISWADLLQVYPNADTAIPGLDADSCLKFNLSCALGFPDQQQFHYSAQLFISSSVRKYTCTYKVLHLPALQFCATCCNSTFLPLYFDCATFAILLLFSVKLCNHCGGMRWHHHLVNKLCIKNAINHQIAF